MSRSYYKTTEMIYKAILNFIGLHLKTEINEALVTYSKHHRSPYISTTFMRFPWVSKRYDICNANRRVMNFCSRPCYLNPLTYGE
ncbi:Uncharacterised protein [Vibrio cholerae]|nr:Uncharacterised protein [Vibrio cholerae]